MTFSKYKRLFLVLLLPLLVCGFGLSLLSPFDSDYSVVCETVFRAEICKRTRGSESIEYKISKERYSARLFLVNATEPDAFIRPLVEASPRLLQKVRIVDFSPFKFTGSPEMNGKIQALEGRAGYLHLGVEAGKRSIIEDNEFFIYCSDLNIRLPGDIYESVCSGMGWQGHLKFKPLGESQEILQTLRTAIAQEIDRKKSDFVVYALIIYPFFVYLFLLLSLAIVLVSKAISFVKNG